MDREVRDKIIDRFRGRDNPNIENETNNLILEKRLTPSERSRHWIHAGTAKKFLPKVDENFKLKERNKKDKIVDTYLDDYGRIRVGSRGFNKLDLKSMKAKKIKIFRTEKKKLFEIEIVRDSKR